MEFETAITWLSLFLDPIAATIFMWFLFCSNHSYMRSRFLRLSIVVGVIGLYGQFLRSWVAIETGIDPRDDELAWWAGKDLALIMLSAYLVLDKLKRLKKEDNQYVNN